MRLTNEEINQTRNQFEDRLALVDGQLTDLRERLHKLYNALETGKLYVEDLAPRIQELKAPIDGLDGKRMEFVERTRSARVERLEASVVNTYLEDLRALLNKGSIMEQESFLRSFIERIAVDLPHVTIDYTIPLKTTQAEPSASEVLSFAYTGGP